MHLDLIRTGRISYEGSIVEACQQIGHTNKGHPIICIADVKVLICNWEGSSLSCLHLNWLNIHSLNTANSKFLKDTLSNAVIVCGLVNGPPYSVYDAQHNNADIKRRVSNDGFVKIANSISVKLKKKI